MTTFSEQFKEVYPKGFSSPVRIFSDEGLSGLTGKRVDVHMHSPATEKLGRPIYSIIHKGLVQGQTDDISIHNARMHVDQSKLKKALANPTKAKDRHTFVRGEVGPHIKAPRAKSLKIRPGSMTDAKTGADISSNMGVVRLNQTQRYKR